MNGEALSLLRAQAMAQWIPERREVTALLLSSEPAVDLELGSTAQMLSRLATSAAADGREFAAITTPVPLSDQPGNAARVAAGLRVAIGTSGLFYESHLADWVDGAGAKESLLREPQAALARPAAPHSPLAPQAETLVQRQLDVLENRAALWQGQAWPGQPVEVRIAEEEQHSDGTTLDAAPAWQASLRLTMPGLGEIEARVALSGRQARLAIHAADQASAGRILDARGDLAHSLGQQGLTLAEARVDHGALPKHR